MYGVPPAKPVATAMTTGSPLYHVSRVKAQASQRKAATDKPESDV